MIGDILNTIAKEVSEYIDSQIEFQSGSKSVVLGKPSDNKGELIIADNTICLTLINIDEEASMRNPMIKKRVDGDKVYTQTPGIALNLSIVFIANFPNDYISELNYITKIMEFFQQKDTFTIANTPSLKKYARNIEQLVFKLSTSRLEDQHNIWSLLGIKYMPSVMYSVGKVMIQEEEKLSEIRVAKRVEHNIHQK
jgi:hypothetical protein